MTRDEARALLNRLTNRERQVVGRIAEGDSYKQAARHLSMSPKTVSVHLYAVAGKLGTRNNVHLARIVWLAGEGV